MFSTAGKNTRELFRLVSKMITPYGDPVRARISSERARRDRRAAMTVALSHEVFAFAKL